MNEKRGKGGIRKGLSKAGAWIRNNSQLVIALTAIVTAIVGLALGLYNKGQIERTNRIAEYTAKPNIKMYYAVSKTSHFEQEFKEHLKGKPYCLMPNSYYTELQDIGEEERLLWLVFENKGLGYADKIYIWEIAYRFGDEPPRSITPPKEQNPRPNPRYGEIPNKILEAKGIAVLLVEILKFEPEYVNKLPGFVNHLENMGFFETFKANIRLHDILTGSPKIEPVKISMHEWYDAWPKFEEYMKKGSGKNEQKKY